MFDLSQSNATPSALRTGRAGNYSAALGNLGLSASSN
jgi:hypothetical protein